MLAAAVLALLLQGDPSASPSVRSAPPTDTASAYLDPAARDIVRRARERRQRVERQIDAYSVTGRQRAHVGVSALGRDRTLYTHELAARIHWQRDQVGRIEVLGAREVEPETRRGGKVPGDLRGEVADLAFDPDALHRSLFSFGISFSVERSEGDTLKAGTNDPEKDRDLVDPLAAGSEAHYRFRAGDTTGIRLPDGTTVRLLELQVIPRRREYRLVRGSLWVDAATYGVVRTVYQMARPFELRLDAPEAHSEIPRPVRAIGPIRAQVRYITVEYGLSKGRWWLPRLIALDARAEAGVLADVPLRFERSYSDYEVTGAAEEATAPTGLAVADESERVLSTCPKEGRPEGTTCQCHRGRCRFWRVEVPADTAALLTSPDLPAPLVEGAGKLITGEEVESLARHVVPSLSSLGDFRPSLGVRLADLEHLRFNRVEGLAVGGGAEVDLGPLQADGAAWLGIADREPKAELGITRAGVQERVRLAGYHRLAPFDASSRALTLGNSLSALLLGRDEADYLLASGVEVTGAPVRAGPWTYGWRLFAEEQDPVRKNTDVSLPSLWDDQVFRDNRAAAPAEQMGLSFGVRTDREGGRSGTRWSAGVTMDASSGTYEFVRSAATAQVGAPLGGTLFAGIEAAAGSSAGELPTQSLWYLGGPRSVRGYAGATAAGEAFWRARGEIATSTPPARLGLFLDSGWAGDRGAWQADPTLLSVGVGASVLDGLLRFDLSRTLRGDAGFRLDLYLDGAF